MPVTTRSKSDEAFFCPWHPASRSFVWCDRCKRNLCETCYWKNMQWKDRAMCWPCSKIAATLSWTAATRDDDTVVYSADSGDRSSSCSDSL